MGLIIALVVMGSWTGHLVYALTMVEPNLLSFWTYLHIVVQAFLYTGLFITAHDSMHGSISKNRRINRALGQIALWLFAAFRYRPMFTNHMAHHRNPCTETDPDFYSASQNPVRWFFHFFLTYVSVIQLLTMALLFNIGMYVLGISVANLIAFWVIPAFLATFQLFFFGTYSPHRLPHTQVMEPHRARTQRKNHVWAMLSCWFFGYHWEHHEYPRMPWWRLYGTK